MGFLKQVHSGAVFGPFRGLIYGVEKVGKSSFPLGSPKPIYADIEGRIDHLDCDSVKINTWVDMAHFMRELREESHDYGTLVVDSISVLETLLKTYICEENDWSVEEAGEFARWIKEAYETHWPMFWAAIERLQREHDMTIWYTAHAAIKKVGDPHGGEGYDRYRPALGGNIGPQAWLHHVDVALFAEFQDIIRKEGRGRGAKVKARTTGRRIAHTTHRPSHDAGNSWNLPPIIPLDYETFDKLRKQGKDTAKTLVEEINRNISSLPQSNRVAARKFIKTYAKDANKLQGFLARILEVIEESEPDEPDEGEKNTTKAKEK